jgi:hypothetical protein
MVQALMHFRVDIVATMVVSIILAQLAAGGQQIKTVKWLVSGT